MLNFWNCWDKLVPLVGAGGLDRLLGRGGRRVRITRLLAVLEGWIHKPVPLRPGRRRSPGDKSPGATRSLIATFMRFSHDISPLSILVLLMFVGVMMLGMVAGKRQDDAGNDVNGLVYRVLAPGSR